MRKPYSTDLSDAEGLCLEGHLPTPENDGRPRVHSLREVLNAIFYIVKSGCAWRLLPHDFLPWKTVYYCFRAWRLNGTWQRMHAALLARVRVRFGKNPQPSCWWCSRQPIDHDHWRGRGRARLRRRQEGKGKKAPPLGRHTGVGAQSEGP